MELITNWFKQHFSNPQVVYLGLFLLVLFAVLIVMGQMIGPILVGIVIAYLLEGLVSKLERMRVPRFVAVLIVFILFLLFVVVILFGLLPLVSQQATQFVQQIPTMLGKGHAAMLKLPDLYPEIISQTQIDEIMTAMRLELTSW
ncbi:MAG TPA: AI-2E family transporter, partial [Arenicellales bacterium]|nr:AI-2E family transporter [Arenicellales bacterium]